MQHVGSDGACTFMTRRLEESEDELLTSLVSRFGKKWALIASHMDNRSAWQVSTRWGKCINPVLAKGPFTPEEDRITAEHVEQYGPCNWPALSLTLGSRRSPKQCRERWINHLNPRLEPRAWTSEEDELIIQEHARLGPRWVTIAPMLRGRSDNAVKNRWNASIKQRLGHLNSPSQEGFASRSSKSSGYAFEDAILTK
jgi:myb-related protein